MKPITELPFSNDFLTSKEHFWNCKTAKELELCHKAGCGDKDHDVLLSIAQNNKKLFRLIATFVPTVDGWSSTEKACVLAAMTLAMKPALITEVGVYSGRSLIPMALAIQENGSGRVVGIDPYSAEASTEGESGENATWWNNQQMHDTIMEKFLSYVKSFRLDSVVSLIRKKSNEVDAPSGIGILSLDGNHTEQAVLDAEKFGQKVILGGIAVLDDLHWQAGGVLRAVDVLEEMGFKECYRKCGPSGNNESNDWNLMQRTKI